jgi:group II intron reverse transcriptase/maturase
MSLEKIETIIDALRQERYQWNPARRVSIPKRTGKKRPLGVTTWSDKLVAEVIRMILRAYFQPQFSRHSHGFRPGKGCHTALREIYYAWKGVRWIIEGDTSDCFGSLSHELLISTLSENIQDGRFLALIRKLLDAGYLEEWTYHQTLSGVPQGSIVSPVLSNILLDKLDSFVETVLIPHSSKGEKRRANKEYTPLLDRAKGLFKQGHTTAAQQLPSYDATDANYRRLRYCSYADDFVLGFTGPKAEAEEIKQQRRHVLARRTQAGTRLAKRRLSRMREAALRGFSGMKLRFDK